MGEGFYEFGGFLKYISDLCVVDVEICLETVGDIDSLVNML